MSAFTDDDLNRLKPILRHDHEDGQCHMDIELTCEQFKALLHRLECAERVAYRLLESTRQCSGGTADIIEAWEKSKGSAKEGGE